VLGGIGGLAAGGGGVAATVAASENSATSDESRGADEPEAAEESGEGEAPTMKERVENLNVLTDATPEQKDIISKSPSLVERLEAHQNRPDAKIIEGTPGGGSSYDPTNGTLTIDPEHAKGNTLAKVLAHESGHFPQHSCDLPPYTDSENSYVNCRVDAEGTAVLQNIKVQREIIANGGPDIGINGSFPQVYNQIFDQQEAGLISKSEAEARIGSIIGQFERSSLAPDVALDSGERAKFQEKHGKH
jgi:type VI secretion system secreted protein VgrG